MKANAPEKIFLEWYRIGDKKYRDWCIIPKTNDESVEYTRTDAFVEKACDYLMEYEFNDSPTIADRRKRVEDFKNYLKYGKVQN